jgi:hypothetical protein
MENSLGTPSYRPTQERRSNPSASAAVTGDHVTLLEHLMKRNHLRYHEAMDHIRFKRVRVSGRVITDPLVDVPYRAIVLVTKAPKAAA